MSFFSNIKFYEINILIILFILFFLIGWLLRKIYKNLYFFYLKYKGRVGEKRALSVLKNNGYQVLDKQFTVKGWLIKNGVRQSFIIRPDYLVKKNNEILIAEVKTGEAASILNISTRRQLLEYSNTHYSKKVLLIDVDKKSLNLIEFLK